MMAEDFKIGTDCTVVWKLSVVLVLDFVAIMDFVVILLNIMPM